jgi:hypothetical protein
MRHGKREGSDVKATPPAERIGNQSRAKQSNNANDNGTSKRTRPKTEALRVQWTFPPELGLTKCSL